MHAKLRATLGNRLSYPGEPGYEEARRVWNAMHDRRPALVARCRSAAEVSLTLRYAVAVGLRVTVRGGGHNVAGTAVADDALMVDLSLMRGVVVDPTERLAVAGVAAHHRIGAHRGKGREVARLHRAQDEARRFETRGGPGHQGSR